MEGQTQDSSQVYHVLEEPEKKDTCETGEVPDGTGNDNLERVYSTLEENIPENGDRDVPERTGDDNPETVYSVLENENAV